MGIVVFHSLVACLMDILSLSQDKRGLPGFLATVEAVLWGSLLRKEFYNLFLPLHILFQYMRNQSKLHKFFGQIKTTYTVSKSNFP